MTHDEDGPPTVYEQVAVLRRRVTLLTEELKRAVAERDEARAANAGITETADKIAAASVRVMAERDTLRALLREWREADDVTQDLMLRTDAALEGRDE